MDPVRNYHYMLFPLRQKMPPFICVERKKLVGWLKLYAEKEKERLGKERKRQRKTLERKMRE